METSTTVNANIHHDERWYYPRLTLTSTAVNPNINRGER